MNKQTFNVLREIIVSGDNVITIDKLSDKINVSKRMIYNYYKDIEFYCAMIGLNDVISFDNGKIIVNHDREKIDYLSGSIESVGFSQYRLDADERKNMIIISLATCYEPIKIDYFQESLFISKNTINTDIKNVKEYFNSVGVGFEKNKKNGLLLNCSEAKRTEIIIDIINSMDAIDEYYLQSPINPCISYLMNYLKINKYRYSVGKIIKEAEDETNCKLSDYYYFKAVFIITILLSRMENGFVLKCSLGQLKEHKNIFTEVLSEKMKDQLNITDDGIRFFHYVLSKFRIKIQVNNKADNPKYINTIIHEFLLKLNESYKVNFYADKVLLEYLNAHIIACYHRVLLNESIDNPYLKQIHDKYSKDYEIIKSNIYVIENGLNISLNDGEIAYILLHILTALERYRQQKLPTIALICGSGMATGNFVAVQIKKHFKCNTVVFSAIHDIDQTENLDDIDLIVSTIPLQMKNIDVLVVNAVLQEKDFNNIYNKLNKNKIIEGNEVQSEHFELTGLDIIRSLFDVNRIEMDLDVSDWKEAIIKVGEKLLWEQMITPNYIHQMINLMQKNGPYMVIAPHIALVHAAPGDGVIKPAIAIVRLKHGVSFGKEGFDPVNILVCCAIEDSPKYINALMRIMSIVKNPLFLEKVLAAKKAQEVYDLFFNY